MNVSLLYDQKKNDVESIIRYNSSMFYDLELEVLASAMANNDKFIYQTVLNVLYSSLSNDTETILFRQDVLKDCIENAPSVLQIYHIVKQITECKNKHWWISSKKHPSSILLFSLNTLNEILIYLKELHQLTIEHEKQFTSKGFKELLQTIGENFDAHFLKKFETALNNLNFENEIQFNARLNHSFKLTDYVLLKNPKTRWLDKIFKAKSKSYSFKIDDHDINGAKILDELRDEALNNIANSLGQATDTITSFFSNLKYELAFYVGCLNVYQKLTEISSPICFPVPIEADKNIHHFEGLYDVCLALTLKQKLVGNSAIFDQKNLIIITGANKGGKSTFLRAIGLAQIMMQSGMFVAASTYTASISNSIFTHFRKEEDSNLDYGKLEEELKRFSEIVPHLKAGSLLLLNESFSSTNEHEASEIARQIIKALIELKAKVFFVTHLYEFAQELYHYKNDNTIFLRAERLEDGTRTFVLKEAEPIQTSHAGDVYEKIFNEPI